MNMASSSKNIETEQGSSINRELCGILFPGIVKNPEKAIECLGGIKKISEAYSAGNKKRLDLNFYPENPFINKAMSDMRKTPGILFKVRIKKTISDGEVKKTVESIDVVGSVTHLFKFDAMADFQYLPLKKEDGELKCIQDSVIPSGLDDATWLEQPGDPYIVPYHFTRSDKPYPYYYTLKKSNAPKGEEDILLRQRTKTYRSFVFSMNEEYPTEPPKEALKAFLDKYQNTPIHQDYEKVKQLFFERPIWSMNGIIYKTSIKRAVVKIVVPFVALYFKDGPWSKMWVRMGYDPRKDPGARIYQTLDFRIRSSNEPLLSGLYKAGKQTTTCKKGRTWHFRSDDDFLSLSVPESIVVFHPGTVPSQKQVYYQFCDIRLPEVAGILAEATPLCHPQRGWLGPDAVQSCRDLVVQYSLRAAQEHDISIKIEEQQGASSEEEQNSDEDEDDEGAMSMSALGASTSSCTS